MSLGRRGLLGAIAALLAFPALGKPAKSRKPKRRAGGPSHPAHAARPHHPARHARAASRVARPKLPVVVIDAGHGGRDPGAIGPRGTLEKSVALATALELGRQLRATRRYRVLLVRDRDVFVSLAARLRTISRSGAALMVSIHADAAPNPKARGASVYVRSPGPEGRTTQLPAHRGAAPAMAEALGGPKPGPELLQLTMLGRLDDDIRMTASAARRAQLYVLAATEIPGVLVEMGYISNRKDEALLRNPRHRATIARAIRDAVEQYFAKVRGMHDPRT